MKKRVFSLFLSLCMVLTLMPTVALASANNPQIYIKGNRFTEYNSITDAIAAAKDEDCIMVEKSVSENIVIPEDKNVSIFTYYSIGGEDKTRPTITNNGTLRLLGNGSIHSGDDENAPGVYNVSGATLIVDDHPNDNSLFSVLSFRGNSAPAIVNEGTMELYAYEITGSADQLIVNRKALDGQTPTLKILGGTNGIKADHIAILNGVDAELIVGTEDRLYPKLEALTGLLNEGSATINDMDFNGAGVAFCNSGSLTINDCYLRRTDEGDLFENTGTLSIFKGHFSQEIPESYIAEGQRCVAINVGTSYESYLVDKAVDLTFLSGNETFLTVKTIAGGTVTIPMDTPAAPTGYSFSCWTSSNDDSTASYWTGCTYNVDNMSNNGEDVTLHAKWYFEYPTITTTPELDKTQTDISFFPYGSTVVLTANHPLGDQAQYVWYGRMEGDNLAGSIVEETKVGEGAVYTASNLRQSMMYRVTVTDPNNPEAITDGYIYIPIASSASVLPGGNTNLPDNSYDDNYYGGSNTTTSVERNPDGSTTTTTTDKTTGTVTETTKNTDGSTTTVATQKDGTVTTTDKAVDGSTVQTVEDKNGNVTAEANVSDKAGAALVEEAVSNAAAEVVIAPEISADATKTEVSVPVSTVKAIAEQTDAAVMVATPVATVAIPNNALAALAELGGSVTVAAERKDNQIAVEISSGDQIVTGVEGGLTVAVPYENTTPGTVAVLVHEDGTKEIIRKSVAVDGTVSIPLDGSATVELMDNSKDFGDVKPTDWHANAVDFVSAHGLFNGTSETTFSPDNTMTRGMLAMVLHNLESNPDHTVGGTFGDVAEGAWYSGAIQWAAEQGIVGGYGDGNFGAEDHISREQLAVMLWNYAGKPESNHALTHFNDTDQISGYAQAALAWANENGIISGMGDGVLNPKGEATRAQVATMLQKLCENGLN